MLKSMIDRLTSSYKKDKDSNIGKVFNLISNELTSVKDTLLTIKKYRTIDDAEGTTLDMIGANVGEYRGQKNEELYRQYIKTRIKANLSGGEMETLIEVLQILFGGSLKSIQETWNINHNAVYDGEPANLVITFYSTPEKIPFDVIDRVVAGGVGAFYFNEEVRDRWLNLETTVKDIDAFHRHVHTFECGELAPNLTEGGYGPSGHIRKTNLDLNTSFDDMDHFNKQLYLESKMVDRDVIYKFPNTFYTGELVDTISQGGEGKLGQIRKTNLDLETKVDELENFKKQLYLESKIKNIDVFFKRPSTFTSGGSEHELEQGGIGPKGQIRLAPVDILTNITDREDYNKYLDFSIDIIDRDILFKYPSTFSAGQEVLL